MAESKTWDPTLALLKNIKPHLNPELARELYILRMRACSDLVEARRQVTSDGIDELCNLALQEVLEKPAVGEDLTRFRSALYTQLERAKAPIEKVSCE